MSSIVPIYAFASPIPYVIDGSGQLTLQYDAFTAINPNQVRSENNIEGTNTPSAISTPVEQTTLAETGTPAGIAAGNIAAQNENEISDRIGRPWNAKDTVEFERPEDREETIGVHQMEFETQSNGRNPYFGGGQDQVEISEDEKKSEVSLNPEQSGDSVIISESDAGEPEGMYLWESARSHHSPETHHPVSESMITSFLPFNYPISLQ